ncbi:hypothetical protein WJX73_003505 [Symbiochloris irregularis]|uniref:Uncharacterized protein n=1 Tax=Symbiochloris irregularis TaxID=706552 RepID=A0AAW1NQE4_9CHLO
MVSCPLDIVVRTAVEVAAVALAAYLVRLAVSKLTKGAKKVLDSQAQSGQVNVAAVVTESAVAAARGPSKLLLPLGALAYIIRVIVLALEIAVRREFNDRRIAEHAVHHAFNVLSRLDTFLGDVWQVAAVVLVCWFVIAWKQQMVDVVTAIAKRVKEEGSGTFDLERVVLPFSTLATWGIIAVGVLMSLHIGGVNIQPLLTVGGVGGLAVGFGAQAVTSNAISGINLFVTRPFVVGDRVELKGTGGGSVIIGVVERIDPMRTVIRTDDSVPVAIPNKAITEMMVSNESRLGSSAVTRSFKDPRRYSNVISLPAGDFQKVPAILADLRQFLSNHTGVDKSLPHDASLASMTSSTINIGITAHTTAVQSRDFGAFNAELLMETAKILSASGAAPYAVAS